MRGLAFELRRLLRRTAVRREIDEELRDYFERAVDDRVRAGIPRDEAERAVHAELGNVTMSREAAAEGGWSGRAARLAGEIQQDLRFALRHYARAPVLSAVIVLLLALGIGLNTALFGLLRSALTSPVPGLQRDDALVRLIGWRRLKNPDVRRVYTSSREIPLEDLTRYAELRQIFAGVAGETNDFVDLRVGKDRPDVFVATFITPGYFELLGVRMAQGSHLPMGDESAAVISHTVWQRRLGESASAVGSVIYVTGQPIRVVGIAPPRFDGVGGGHAERIWLPIASRLALVIPERLNQSGPPTLDAVARLRPGVSMREAAAAVAALTPSLAATAPEMNVRQTTIHPLLAMNSSGDQTDLLLATAIASGVSILVLLVTCTNVSALLIGRALARRREIAVRLSLGAPRRRIVRQLLVEGGLLALTGGAIGLAVCWWIARVVGHIVTDFDVTVDWGTTAIMLAVALGATIVFALSPALHASRISVADALKQSSGAASAQSRLQRSFVIAEVALTQPLLVALATGIGIAWRGLEPYPSRALAPRTAHVMVSAPSDEDVVVMTDKLLARYAELPGVEMVSTFTYAQRGMVSPGMTSREGALELMLSSIGPAYFAMRAQRVSRGREFTSADRANADHLIVIPDTLATLRWPGENPIGKTLTVRGLTGAVETRTVVGTVSPRSRGGMLPNPNSGYVPTRPGLGGGLSAYVSVRTNTDAAPLLPVLRQIGEEVAPNARLSDLSTSAQDNERKRDEAYQVSQGVATAGLFTLLLAAVGLYAVVSFGVVRRAREVGVRMALGARPSDVVALFVRGGLRLCGIGMLIGLPLSVAALKVTMSLDGDFRTSVVAVGGSVALFMVAVGLAATWVPARRAAHIDPVRTLRVD